MSSKDKATLDNRSKQLNPNNPQSGPGRNAGSQGEKSKPDKDNRSNQLNPNNWRYQGGQGSSGSGSGKGNQESKK
ncbi:unnamed protein product [Allacma fusca]|uniref:Uncharacterized protein n=1 Tax=Allacma fusca TaxID=39272 RepID=A0A8J2K1H0_9HEXA|nr:unnamed protein product [Allacma fusca]